MFRQTAFSSGVLSYLSGHSAGIKYPHLLLPVDGDEMHGNTVLAQPQNGIPPGLVYKKYVACHNHISNSRVKTSPGGRATLVIT